MVGVYPLVVSNYKMNKILCLIVLVLFFSSCESQVNHIVIDKIVTIDVFETYIDNLNLGTDILHNDWGTYLTNEIEGFETKTKMTFFLNTRPQEGVCAIQLRYPKDSKPDNYEQVRNKVIGKIEEAKNIHRENEKFLVEARQLTEKVYELIDGKKYSEFYDLFHEKAKKTFTKTEFEGYMTKRESMEYSDQKREYYTKSVFFFDENKPSKQCNIIEMHFVQSDNYQKYESINFEVIGDKLELIGYHIN